MIARRSKQTPAPKSDAERIAEVRDLLAAFHKAKRKVITRAAIAEVLVDRVPLLLEMIELSSPGGTRRHSGG